MGVDILALWGHAGPFARGVVFVMIAMSLMSFTVAFKKLWYFYKSTSATRKFAPQFSRAIQEEQLDQAITLAEKNKASHVARVLGGALGEVKPFDHGGATSAGADVRTGEGAIEGRVLLELVDLERVLGKKAAMVEVPG